jgi:sulfate permease, SulP family
MKLFSNIKGDISGAISASILQFPSAITFGIVAFAPLGVGFASQAAMYGIYGAIFCGFFASVFGSSRFGITGPSASLSLITASLIVSLATRHPHALPQAIDQRTVALIGLAAVCVFTGGAIQALFGAFRMGSIIKYIPYPIVSGFMSGIAINLILGQLKPLIGMDRKASFLDIFTNPAVSVQPKTCMVGLFTLLVLFNAGRLTKKVPAALMGLVCGTGFQYGLVFIAGPSGLGPVVGTVQSGFPRPDIFFKLFNLTGELNASALIPDILATGLVLALFGSCLTLLTSVALDNLTGTRQDSDRELIGQGIGNMVSAVFGGVAGTSAIPRSLANFEAGGRTRLSGMICGLLLLAIAITSGPLVGKLPIVVFAAIAIMTGVKIFDRWHAGLFRKLVNMFRKHGRVSLRWENQNVVDFATATIVAGVIIVGNLVFAVGLGVAIASVFFIMKMGKSVILYKRYGNQLHSRRVRTAKEAQFLEREGRLIVVFELQGALFFGSAEKLAKEIELSLSEARYCILDMTHVVEIDTTGANILFQVTRTAGSRGQHLLIGHMGENPSLKRFLRIMDYTGDFDHNLFTDCDTAMEWAEDHLLAEYFFAPGLRHIALHEMDIVEGFSISELDRLEKGMIHKTYAKGDLIVGKGAENRDLYLLIHGSISLKIPLSNNNRMERLVSFGPGGVFGTIGLLEEQPLSASVFADNDCVLYKLTYREFLTLREEMPDLTIKLLTNIGKILSRYMSFNIGTWVRD